jgi:hypothetical protein
MAHMKRVELIDKKTVISAALGIADKLALRRDIETLAKELEKMEWQKQNFIRFVRISSMN